MRCGSAACAKHEPAWFALGAAHSNAVAHCIVQGERRSRLGGAEQSQQAAPSRLSGRRPQTGAERGLLLLLLIAASVAAVHLAPTYAGAFQHMRVHSVRRAQRHSMGLGDAADSGASAGNGEHHSGINRTLSFDVCHGFGHQRLSLLSGAAPHAAVAAEPARQAHPGGRRALPWAPALPSLCLLKRCAALSNPPPCPALQAWY